METMGLVERQTRKTDRRANSLRLKALGRRKYEAARQVAVKLQTEILSTLPPPARERFLKELNAVAEACRRAVDHST